MDLQSRPCHRNTGGTVRPQETKDMSTKRTGSPTARKVVGSLAVIGTAAAVAGLGTYGNFTDSTTPVNTTLSTGTLSINLTQVGAALPVSVAGMVPGDQITRTVDLVNDGDLAMSSVAVSSSALNTSILTTDTINGLKLTVRSCSVPWSAGYTCSGTQSTLLGGPVVNNGTLTNPASLNPNGVDHLAYTIALPATAGNEFQGKTAQVSLAFTGVSRNGTNR
jgi:Camelysin metallo-endopeptidase